jgi:hypothetical protein
MVKTILRFWLLLMALALAGCAAKIPHTLVAEYGKMAPRLIAVLPTADKASDALAAGMLRVKLIEELHFKGYPRLRAEAVDSRLQPQAVRGSDAAATREIGARLQVDAILYATLNESRRGGGILYSPTVVDASFELRSARTGERLWQVRHQVVRRHYGFTRKQIEMQASQAFEAALGELVSRVLDTLPDGLEGAAP